MDKRILYLHHHTYKKVFNVFVALILLLSAVACQKGNTVSLEEYNKLQQENTELRQQENQRELEALQLEALKKENEALKKQAQEDKEARLNNRVAELESELKEVRDETKEAKESAKAAQQAFVANTAPYPVSSSGEVFVGRYSDGTSVFLLPASISIINSNHHPSSFWFRCTVKAGSSKLEYSFFPDSNGRPYYQNNEGYSGFVFDSQSPVAKTVYEYVVNNY